MNRFLAALRAMLLQCYYLEDVLALKHFVFHYRYNGCSNACLLCGCAASTEDDLWSEGHAADCPYVQAVVEARKHETLKAYVDRQ